MTAVEANSQVHQRIAKVARSLHNPELGADEIAQRIVASAVHAVPGAQYAAITFAVADHVEITAASAPYPAVLDAIQERHEQGPFLGANRGTVRVDDLDKDTRWPLFRRDALHATPIRSILSFRLFTSDQSLSALTVYADRPRALTIDGEDVGYALATYAALVLDAARRDQQFRDGLHSRDIIGQAKGILMARFGIDAEAAFGLLKRISQSSNTRLTDVARRLAAMGCFDDLSAGPVDKAQSLRRRTNRAG